ncbi:hypothetical protein HK105_204996 [Polyrhizophydium stewartii]|uniref:PHD-type domain-containing protein n=1 Tax=Polyrhizophydium stewartii TaxID=2732419 RepID=A0ABR4N7C8_9FUNG
MHDRYDPPQHPQFQQPDAYESSQPKAAFDEIFGTDSDMSTVHTPSLPTSGDISRLQSQRSSRAVTPSSHQEEIIAVAAAAAAAAANSYVEPPMYSVAPASGATPAQAPAHPHRGLAPPADASATRNPALPTLQLTLKLPATQHAAYQQQQQHSQRSQQQQLHPRSSSQYGHSSSQPTSLPPPPHSYSAHQAQMPQQRPQQPRPILPNPRQQQSAYPPQYQSQIQEQPGTTVDHARPAHQGHHSFGGSSAHPGQYAESQENGSGAFQDGHAHDASYDELTVLGGGGDAAIDLEAATDASSTSARGAMHSSSYESGLMLAGTEPHDSGMGDGAEPYGDADGSEVAGDMEPFDTADVNVDDEDEPSSGTASNSSEHETSGDSYADGDPDADPAEMDPGANRGRGPSTEPQDLPDDLSDSHMRDAMDADDGSGGHSALRASRRLGGGSSPTLPANGVVPGQEVYAPSRRGRGRGGGLSNPFRTRATHASQYTEEQLSGDLAAIRQARRFAGSADGTPTFSSSLLPASAASSQSGNQVDADGFLAPSPGGARRPLGSESAPTGQPWTARKRQRGSQDNCSACLGKGELLCCDTCPRVFHFSCVPEGFTRNNVPEGFWQCRICTRESEGRRTRGQSTTRYGGGRGRGRGRRVGPMRALIELVNSMNPRAFQLPTRLQCLFDDVIAHPVTGNLIDLRKTDVSAVAAPIKLPRGLARWYGVNGPHGLAALATPPDLAVSGERNAAALAAAMQGAGLGMALTPGTTTAAAANATASAASSALGLMGPGLEERMQDLASKLGLLENERPLEFCHGCRKTGLRISQTSFLGSYSVPQPHEAGTNQTTLQTQRSELIKCDYCPLYWHLDCLTPPLTAVPLELRSSSQEVIDTTEWLETKAEVWCDSPLDMLNGGQLRMTEKGDLKPFDRALRAVDPGLLDGTKHLVIRNKWMCPCHADWVIPERRRTSRKTVVQATANPDDVVSKSDRVWIPIEAADDSDSDWDGEPEPLEAERRSIYSLLGIGINDIGAGPAGATTRISAAQVDPATAWWLQRSVVPRKRARPTGDATDPPRATDAEPEKRPRAESLSPPRANGSVDMDLGERALSVGATPTEPLVTNGNHHVANGEPISEMDVPVVKVDPAEHDDEFAVDEDVDFDDDDASDDTSPKMMSTGLSLPRLATNSANHGIVSVINDTVTDDLFDAMAHARARQDMGLLHLLESVELAIPEGRIQGDFLRRVRARRDREITENTPKYRRTQGVDDHGGEQRGIELTAPQMIAKFAEFDCTFTTDARAAYERLKEKRNKRYKGEAGSVDATDAHVSAPAKSPKSPMMTDMLSGTLAGVDKTSMEYLAAMVLMRRDLAEEFE